MAETDRLAALFTNSTANTVLSWLFVAVLIGALARDVSTGQYGATLLTIVAIAIILAPAVAFRDPTVVPPWQFLGLICLPLLWQVFIPSGPATAIVPSLSTATLGLLFVVELHLFTDLRLVPWLSVVLTVLVTLAVASVRQILRWSADVLLGTSFLLDGRSGMAINRAVMIEFLSVAVAGVVAGVAFYRYFQRTPGSPDSRIAAEDTPPTETPSEAALISDRLSLSTARQRRIAAVMQAMLGLVFLYGLWTRQLPLLVNAGTMLGITFLPAVLERDYGIPIEPGLALWITSAVFLHALGTVGLYDVLSQWDTLTHLYSATVIAAAGYTTLRVIHLHVPSVYLPPWAMFAFTIVFVVAMGVAWEILEFFADQSARHLGVEAVLAQRGIDDTITDMLFNAVGAVLVATWGTTYLVRLSDTLAAFLEDEMDG